MAATFKFNKERTYTLTETQLARILGNHVGMYYTMNSGKVVKQEAMEESYKMTLEEMKNGLIERLDRPYNEIIEEAENAIKKILEISKNI